MRAKSTNSLWDVNHVADASKAPFNKASIPRCFWKSKIKWLFEEALVRRTNDEQVLGARSIVRIGDRI
jgi:hypothetical protein